MTEGHSLPGRELAAVDHAVAKLEAMGPDLPYPQSSAVQGADRLRELRPRGGRSPWRVFYRRIAEVFVIGSVGPEAKVKPKGFEQAVRRAEQRLAEVEES